MTSDDYIRRQRTTARKRIPADIIQRWSSRVLPRGLHTLGEAGARQYLADYGRGIAAPKVIVLALKAEAEGYPAMAHGFWVKALELEGGQASANTSASPEPSPIAAGPPGKARPSQQVAELPDHLQPGALATMQPVDAPKDRQHYVDDSEYWGQPKRDGKRLVVIAGNNQIYYQSRSTNLVEPPSAEIHDALVRAAAQFGPFVLDGELYYPDYQGGEHRTGAQAATVNLRTGHAGCQPVARYAVFKALFADDQDLTGYTECERVAHGEIIGKWLEAQDGERFELLPTARTAEEKALLAARQQAQGREGEVWIRHGCRYRGRKDTKSQDFVRTKYLLELDVVVLNLTPTTAEGRPFGAIEVGTTVGGSGGIVLIGSVGTGYTIEQMHEIARRHSAAPGQLVVTVQTQGFTESGQLWHGRFVDFRDDKAPEQCAPDGMGLPTLDGEREQTLVEVPRQLALF